MTTPEEERINKVISMAVEKIYEQSTGITQQEIERVIRKVIVMVGAMVLDYDISIESLEEIFYGKE